VAKNPEVYMLCTRYKVPPHHWEKAPCYEFCFLGVFLDKQAAYRAMVDYVAQYNRPHNDVKVFGVTSGVITYGVNENWD